MSSIAGTYLERIVADVRARLDALDAAPARADVQQPRSLAAAIRDARGRGELAVIGEVKRRSPSVGAIDESVDPAAQAVAYAGSGAAGISVLTERDHFGGSLDDLTTVAAAVHVPVLCKDFIVDERQLDLAAGAGAHAVLLIAAIHGDDDLAALVDGAHDRGMQVLLEVHDEHELERALATRTDVIGVNNRDLRSFVVDLAVTEQLAPRASVDPRPIVAESGVRTPADAARMRACGVDALLVGEALMRSRQPGGLLRELATARLQGASA
ncbi:MAG: indole-3-glycerol-phosphate synthase [Thermoleophilia bacterium]|nr:indole-3-glycerol-phosphate synthase [Thermoleophilia bacterium]